MRRDLGCSLTTLCYNIIGRSLNVAKTKSMLLSRKRNPPALCLKIDDADVERVRSFRYLGVTITEDLRWTSHIDNICCKSRKLLGFLYRGFRFGDRKCLAYLYGTLVRPILDYCSCVWDPGYANARSKVERVQSFAARLVTGKWSCDQADSLHQEMGWPLLSQRREYMKLCLCRRILCGESLIPCSVYSPAPSHAMSLRSMNSCQLYAPTVRTNLHQHSFFISVTKLWNAIPDHIIGLGTTRAFKAHLRQYMVI